MSAYSVERDVIQRDSAMQQNVIHDYSVTLRIRIQVIPTFNVSCQKNDLMYFITVININFLTPTVCYYWK